jgi:hypothetical protein
MIIACFSKSAGANSCSSIKQFTAAIKNFFKTKIPPLKPITARPEISSVANFADLKLCLHHRPFCLIKGEKY